MSKSISQLDTEAIAHITDLFEVAVADVQSATGYSSGKMSAEVIAEGMLNNFTYPTAMPNMQNKTITGAINQMLANFAPVYDETATYSKDDVVTYNGQLYKANQDISVAEAWDSTHWTAIVVKQISGNQHDYSTTEQVVGKWIDGSTLYEKTIFYDNQATIGDGYTPIESLSNIAHIDIISGGIINSSDHSYYAIPYVFGNKSTSWYFDNGDLGIRVANDTWSSDWDIFVTVRYTKSTS